MLRSVHVADVPWGLVELQAIGQFALELPESARVQACALGAHGGKALQRESPVCCHVVVFDAVRRGFSRSGFASSTGTEILQGTSSSRRICAVTSACCKKASDAVVVAVLDTHAGL